MNREPGREWRLGDLARALDLPFDGRPDAIVRHAADVAAADEEALSAVYDGRMLGLAQSGRAGVLIVSREMAGKLPGRNIVLAAAPKAAFARAIELIHPVVRPVPGVHASAVLGRDVELGESVSVGANAVIGDRCRIGARSSIGPGSVLMDEVELGEDVAIHPRVVVYPRAMIGPRSALLAGSVVGAPGFGHARDTDGTLVRVPHLGRVVLAEDVEVGANATIDCATFGETRIGARSRIDNLVQIGHNAVIGADTMIAAQSGLSGSSSLGSRVVVGGQSGLADHVTVGDGAAIAAKTAVFHDVEPGQVVAGVPAIPISRWRRLVAIQAKLPDVWKRILRCGRGAEGDDA